MLRRITGQSRDSWVCTIGDTKAGREESLKVGMEYPFIDKTLYINRTRHRDKLSLFCPSYLTS